MEEEFLEWYKENETRFFHGQFDDKQIAYSAWLKGKQQVNTGLHTIPYQCCPVCNGKGEVIADGFTSAVYQKCTVCDGQKIIPEAIIAQSAKLSEG